MEGDRRVEDRKLLPEAIVGPRWNFCFLLGSKRQMIWVKTTKGLFSFTTYLGVALLAFVSGIAVHMFWSATTFRPVSKQHVPAIHHKDKQEVWFPKEPRESVKQGEFGTLRGRILDAKADGDSSVELSVLACGWEIGGLREALARDTVVVAQLQGKETFKDRYGLYTWYKFTIVETLSERPVPEHLGFLFRDQPADMFPVNQNEFLIRETNGSMEIDGVTVTQHSNGAKYVGGRTYVLFLQLEPTKRIAVRSGTDPLGVFTVDEDGTLRAYIDRPFPLRDQMAKRFGNSLE
jgi:hypothetical protein